MLCYLLVGFDYFLHLVVDLVTEQHHDELPGDVSGALHEVSYPLEVHLVVAR